MTHELTRDYSVPLPGDYPARCRFTGETLLEVLKEASVLSIYPSQFRTGFCLQEACDDYFDVFMTPAQLYQLGIELQEMAKTFIDQPLESPPSS